MQSICQEISLRSVLKTAENDPVERGVGKRLDEVDPWNSRKDGIIVLINRQCVGKIDSKRIRRNQVTVMRYR